MMDTSDEEWLCWRGCEEEEEKTRFRHGCGNSASRQTGKKSRRTRLVQNYLVRGSFQSPLEAQLDQNLPASPKSSLVSARRRESSVQRTGAKTQEQEAWAHARHRRDKAKVEETSKNEPRTRSGAALGTWPLTKLRCLHHLERHSICRNSFDRLRRHGCVIVTFLFEKRPKKLHEPGRRRRILH